MRLFSDNQWTSWKSSDYFYPETIPEPDYSDSEDDCSSENRISSYSPDTRSPIERLRDLTEIYISDLDVEKRPVQPKITLDNQGTSKAPKNSSNEVNTMSAKRSPKASPRTNRSKSPTNPATSAQAQRSRAQTKSPARSREKAGSTKTSPARDKTSKPTPKTKATNKTKAETKTYPATAKKGAGDASDADMTGASSGASSDEDLIKPRKPYQTSSERIKLHKELKFSQKYCKLASSKTELQLALERYTENKVRREMDAEEKSSLEKILEHQAKRIEMQEAMDKEPDWIENLQRQPATWSDPRTDEFYRVHAKVVSNNILTECFLPEDDQSGCCSSNTLPNTDSGSES